MSLEAPVEVVKAARDRSSTALYLWMLKVWDKSGTLRFVNDGARARGPDNGIYAPYPLQITLPKQTGEEGPVIRVTVDDLPLVIVEKAIEAAGTHDAVNASIFVCVRGVTEEADSGKPVDQRRHCAFIREEGFELRNVRNTEERTDFMLVSGFALDAPLTRYWFGPGDFPGGF